jgi:hypothetical protein
VSKGEIRPPERHLSPIPRFVVLLFAEKQLKYRGRTQSMSNEFTDNLRFHCAVRDIAAAALRRRLW